MTRYIARRSQDYRIITRFIAGLLMVAATLAIVWVAKQLG